MNKKYFARLNVLIIGVFFLSLFGVVSGVQIRHAEALIVSGINVTNISQTSATVSWTTDIVSSGLVEYGTSQEYELWDTDENLSQTHNITLTDLLPGSKYYFRVNAADDTGTVTTLAGNPFTTLSSSSGAQSQQNVVTNVQTNQQNTTAQGLQYPTEGLQYPDDGLEYEEPAPYPTGTLAKEEGGNTIYFLMAKDLVKIPFTSLSVFNGLGYQLKNVVTGDLSSYRVSANYFISSATQAHPWGSCLLWNDGTVFYAYSEGLAGIPDLEVFNDLGCTQQNLVKFNKADMAVWDSNPNLPAMQYGDNRAL